jgi:hypothetical protein
MEEEDVVRLRESVLDMLMVRFAKRLLDEEVVAEANGMVRERFSQLGKDGVLPVMFGDGAGLTGYDVAIDYDRSSLGLTPQTEFFPTHRYRFSGPPGDDRIALGFSGKFDLWVMREKVRPPTIIARYGAGGDEYLSANPGILGLEIVRKIGEPFPEALRRLVLLGLLDENGVSDPEDLTSDPSDVFATAASRPTATTWRKMTRWWSRQR